MPKIVRLGGDHVDTFCSDSSTTKAIFIRKKYENNLSLLNINYLPLFNE